MPVSPASPPTYRPFNTDPAAPVFFLDAARRLSRSQPVQASRRAALLNEYLVRLQGEPPGVRRRFLIVDLIRNRDAFPELKGVIHRLESELVPVSPPYDAWFAGGKRTLTVDFYPGDGFHDDELEFLKKNGFRVSAAHGDDLVLSRRISGGPKLGSWDFHRYSTKVDIRFHASAGGLFSNMGDPDVGMVVYAGHAGYGSMVASHLKQGSAMTGAKLFVGLQCEGRGNQQALFERYPSLQVIGTRRSSYEPDDRKAFLAILSGIAARESWPQISKRVSRRATNNYYFPSDLNSQLRVEDLDHDGIADSLDRVGNADRFGPDVQPPLGELAPSTRRSTYEAPNGPGLHTAALRFQRLSKFNEWWHRRYPALDVLSGGFFPGLPLPPVARVERQQGAYGKTYLLLKINDAYANTKEALLGAAIHFDLGRLAALEDGLSSADAKLAGLLLAAKSIEVDADLDDDDDSFTKLLRYAHLDESIPFDEVKRALGGNEDFLAGTSEGLARLKAVLAATGIGVK